MVVVTELLAGMLPGLAGELAEVTERLRSSVVLVQGRGAGSGVIWESNGLVITNHHVVAGDEAEVALADGRSLPAKVIARDPLADLAALRVAAVGLPAVTTRDAGQLRVGELVLAVGNPLGLRGAVTAGIVSAVGRRLSLGGGQWRDVVQADIALQPGNSGGALVDAAGQVVGLNAMVVPPRLALAVPSETIAGFLLRGGVRRPRLGIEGTLVPLPEAVAVRFGSPAGVVLAAVQPGSAAERAGLLVGDVLVALDGRPLGSPDALAARLASPAARPLRLTLLRGGRHHEVDVQLDLAA